MIDLTPLDVRKKRGDFRRILRGYDPVEVDTFLELVESRLESLVVANLALTDKVAHLETTVKALEEREKAVQDALVTAQKLREEVHQQSRREVELLKREAEADLERLRREAEVEVDRRLREVDDVVRSRQRDLEDLERNRRKFLRAFRTLLERELDGVEVEEMRAPLDETPLDLELRGWGRTSQDVLGEEEPEEPDREELRDEESAGQGSGDGWVMEIGATLMDREGSESDEPEGAAEPGVERTPSLPDAEKESEGRAEKANEGEGGAAPPSSKHPHWLSALLKEEDRVGRKPPE